jgi:hypothetical protein
MFGSVGHGTVHVLGDPKAIRLEPAPGSFDMSKEPCDDRSNTYQRHQTDDGKEVEEVTCVAVQGQSYGPMFDEKLTVAAWKTKQSWAIISTKDRMLPPAMEESAARRMGAVTTAVETCHMSILQEPARVAAVVDEAA